MDDSTFASPEILYAESVGSSTHTQITAETDYSGLSTLSSISTRGDSPDPHPAAFDTFESHAEPLQRLSDALENSDLSNCWDDMAGVLLWIGLTATTASSSSHDKLLRKRFSALTIRVSMFLCFEHPAALHATLIRMEAINKKLRRESEDAWGLGGERDLLRKRMKV